MIGEKIYKRITQLVDDAKNVVGVSEFGFADKPDLCEGWLSAAVHVVSLLGASVSSYKNNIDRIVSVEKRGHIDKAVISVRAILIRMLQDLDDGLITSIVDRVAAETFDDFIDHAEAYLKEGRKDPAGAICGVAFEDTIRRLCHAHNIEDEGKTCEPLINALITGGVLERRAFNLQHTRHA